MRKTLMTFCMSLATISANAQEIGYEVSGIVPDSIKKVYIYTFETTNPSICQNIDSTDVANGTFVLKGKCSKNANYQVGVPGTKLGYGLFFDGTPISIDFQNNVVKASADNDKLLKLKQYIFDSNEKWYATIMELSKYADDKDKKDSLIAERDKIIREKSAYSMKCYMENKNSIIGLGFLSYIAHELPDEELVEAVSSSRIYYGHPLLEEAKKELAKREEIKALRHVGEMFIDVKMDDPQMKSHKLSEWVGKGKYVLIDFWASWCGPCRAEMPNVLENYNKYKDKGFEVVGISLDTKSDAWVSGIKKLDIPFPQLSELSGWKGEYHKKYGIKTIPANLLIDPNGRIIACDLRAAKLSSTLEKIFENK